MLDLAVVAQVAEAMTPELFAQMVREVPPLAASPARETTVGEHTGMGYRIDDESKISLVVSTDPELDLIGQVIAIHFDTWTMMQGPMGRLSAPLGQMFHSGAAIRYGDANLVSVEKVDIDDAHFELPGQPLDWAQTRAVLRRAGLIEN